MTVSLDVWQLVTLLGAVISAFGAIAKFMLAQAQRNIDDKFQQMGAHMRAQDESGRRLERDLMELKAELPRDYVRREDYTQAVATIMTKIDAMTLRVEAMFRDLITNKSNNGKGDPS